MKWSAQLKHKKTGSTASLKLMFDTEERCEAFEAKVHVEAMKRVLPPAGGPLLNKFSFLIGELCNC